MIFCIYLNSVGPNFMVSIRNREESGCEAPVGLLIIYTNNNEFIFYYNAKQLYCLVVYNCVFPSIFFAEQDCINC